MPATTQTESRRELAQRSSNGIDVTLSWNPVDGSVVVTVDDSAGASFELTVAPERALDAFNHPYAYAALHGATELLDVAA